MGTTWCPAPTGAAPASQQPPHPRSVDSGRRGRCYQLTRPQCQGKGRAADKLSGAWKLLQVQTTCLLFSGPRQLGLWRTAQLRPGPGRGRKEMASPCPHSEPSTFSSKHAGAGPLTLGLFNFQSRGQRFGTLLTCSTSALSRWHRVAAESLASDPLSPGWCTDRTRGGKPEAGKRPLGPAGRGANSVR